MFSFQGLLISIFLPLLLFGQWSLASSLNISDAEIQRVAQSLGWRLLLHFPREPSQGGVSELDGGDFFLSPNGRKDPLAELKATLDHINSDRQLGPLKQVPICAMAARYEWLSRELDFTLPKVECEKLNEFLARFKKPKSVSLVFSAAYANNPASMFGHLFLKLASDETNDLLNHGINYAAHVPADENPFAFFYFGTFGGYEGHWSVQPYYNMLNEYARAENRDLWEYEMNFTPEEVLWMLKHLWELETTSMKRYYFFDDNCAYEMVKLFEVVRPDWDLTHHRIYAIPGEMIKNLFQSPQYVREVRFRPSLRKILFQKYNALEGQDKADFFELVQGLKPPEQIQKTFILDVANSYFDFQRQLDKGVVSEKDRKTWDSILKVRSGRPTFEPPSLEKIQETTRPDLGHDAYAFRPYLGFESSSTKTSWGMGGLQLKSAYHDLLNWDLGYKENSEILFPWLDLRYNSNSQQIRVEEVGGVKITSLVPISRIDFAPSWRVQVAATTPKDGACQECRAAMWESGLGLTTELWSSRNVIYSFGVIRLEGAEEFSKGHRWLPRLEAGWLSTLSDKWKFNYQAAIQNDLEAEALVDETIEHRLRQSFSIKRNLELRQDLIMIQDRMSQHPKYLQLSLSAEYYFR